MPKTVKFMFNGRAIEAPEGTLVIDAAKAAGVSIPHYCYHPALGNPGVCRICIVEVQGAPKPQVSCRLKVAEGMVVRSDSDVARRAQTSSLEFHLENHPLDCPVCDQSGECKLQDYYMKFGRYQSAVREDKIHKNKRIEAGPHVMLDQERCILCTRCTRFVDEVTKTGELAIFGRGHQDVIDVVPGKTLDNPYSGNVVDICPVGALTDKDFRFKVRVWYLDEHDSICPGCSRGCSISVHTNTKRPWHNEGKSVARVKPRLNPEVNGYWICDEGRYGFENLNEDRLGRVMRLKEPRKELGWDEMLSELAAQIKDGISRKGAEGFAVIASGALSNEDWVAFKELFADTLKVSRFLFGPEPDQVGEEDNLLRCRDKVPNLKGGEALGFGARIKSMTWDSLAADIKARKIWGLYIIDRDAAKVWKTEGPGLINGLDLAVFQGPNKGQTGSLAHYRLPATAYIEEDGHFTNFEGKVQTYKKGLEPLGVARPDWQIFNELKKEIERTERTERKERDHAN